MDNSISTEVLIIIFLLILNAFFALSEMAIVSAKKPLLRYKAKTGHKSALLALSLAENPGRFLSTVQVGITLVGIFAGAYGGATIAEKLEPSLNTMPWIYPHGEIFAVILVVSIITFFSVTMGELIPKQIALSNPEKLAILVAYPMFFLSKIFTPVVIILELTAAFFIRMLGIKERDDTVTEAEIAAVLEEGAASGAIENHEREMMQRIIRLGDRDVKSIMTHRTEISFIDIRDDIEKIRKTILAAGHSRYPVIDKDDTKVLGIVKTKDLLVGALANEKMQLENFIREVVFLPENTRCVDALNIFKSKKVHMAVVVDEYGSVEGIFTTADITEAIVGALPSNYDNNEAPMIVIREDGSFLVDGLTPIDEIHMSIGLQEIEVDGDYNTIAGYIMQSLKVFPVTGSTLHVGNYKLEVIDMDGHRIDKILISKLSNFKEAK